MTVPQIRIDYRLVHGLVVQGLPPAFDLIVIVDDEIAHSRWEQELYQLGVPATTDVRFDTISQAVEHYPLWEASALRTLVLTRDLGTARHLVEATGTVPREVAVTGLTEGAAGRYFTFGAKDLDDLRFLKDEGVRLSAQRTATLRVTALRAGNVGEVVDFLAGIAAAYDSLFPMFSRLEREATITRSQAHAPDPSAPVLLLDEPNPEPLLIARIQINSPGLWDFLGSLSPLEVLRRYLNDRHERKRGEDFRALELEEKRLQNEMLRTQVIRERIALFREVDEVAALIQAADFARASVALGRLDSPQDNGLIGAASRHY
jgi:mannose/fructose/N-acetylgalactosamine-specific phosphotransferase system component IIB